MKREGGEGGSRQSRYKAYIRPGHGGIIVVDGTVTKEFVEEVKRQWKRLWRERVDDRLRAEGIANKDYPMLFVGRGTIIYATRRFKMPSLREILELHGVDNAERFIPPNPQVGGWRKFIKTTILARSSGRKAKRAFTHPLENPQKQQLKKGGRGWLHII